MDNNIGKALWIGVGVLFFIAVVSLGLSMLDQGRGIVKEQSENLSMLQKKLSEAEFDIYDNQTVSGAQVLAAIKNFREAKDIFSIKVTTHKATKVYLNSANFNATDIELGSAFSAEAVELAIKEARDQSKQDFINPVAKFDAQLLKDSNDVIAGIVFIQE